MHRFVLFLTLILPAVAQQFDLDQYLKLLDRVPGASVADKVRSLDSLGITLSERGMRQLMSAATPAPVPTQTFGSPQLQGSDSQHKYLGNLNANPYDANSISNPYGPYGSPYSPNSVNNPYGVYGSPYSPYSATNPYATQAPAVTSPTGQYLGRFSSNPYDANSISNPYGPYGSPYSPNSVNNPYGVYGSPYSPYSATNPYATQAPVLPSVGLPPLPSVGLPPLPSVGLPPLH